VSPQFCGSNSKRNPALLSGAGGPQYCTVPECTNKAAARSLCWRHYQYARRHGGFQAGHRGGEAQIQSRNGAAPRQNGSGNGAYDERFCGLFLSELELRGSPLYPQAPWFTALTRADDEYRRLGPLRPAIGATYSPESSGVPEACRSQRGEEDLSRSVNAACTKWLKLHC
jgi:hypothetical protein